MSKFRLLLFGALATVGSAALVASAGTEASDARPFKVRIMTFDGKPRVKVAKKLKVRVRCNRDCAAKVNMRLTTPVGLLRVAGNRDLSQAQDWPIAMILNRSGVKALRSFHRHSLLKVVIRARDLKSGKVQHKTKIYRFRR